jgi:hypothetical protein
MSDIKERESLNLQLGRYEIKEQYNSDGSIYYTACVVVPNTYNGDPEWASVQCIEAFFPWNDTLYTGPRSRSGHYFSSLDRAKKSACKLYRKMLARYHRTQWVRRQQNNATTFIGKCDCAD